MLDGIGFNLGEMRLSLLLLLQAAIVLALLIAGARLITQTMAVRIERNEDISPSMRVLAVKFLQVALYGAAIVIGLRAVGVDLTGLAVLSGAIGVGLGFGLQKVVFEPRLGDHHTARQVDQARGTSSASATRSGGSRPSAPATPAS